MVARELVTLPVSVRPRGDTPIFRKRHSRAIRRVSASETRVENADRPLPVVGTQSLLDERRERSRQTDEVS